MTELENLLLNASQTLLDHNDIIIESNEIHFIVYRLLYVKRDETFQQLVQYLNDHYDLKKDYGNYYVVVKSDQIIVSDYKYSGSIVLDTFNTAPIFYEQLKLSIL